MNAETVHLIALQLSNSEKGRLVRLLQESKGERIETMSQEQKENIEQIERIKRRLPFKYEIKSRCETPAN